MKAKINDTAVLEKKPREILDPAIPMNLLASQALGSVKKRKRQKLSSIVEAYQEEDLKLYVMRRAFAKNKRDNTLLSSKEKVVCKTLEALILAANELEIQTMQDALDCMHLWHSETMQLKKSWETSPADQLITKVFSFLRENYNE